MAALFYNSATPVYRFECDIAAQPHTLPYSWATILETSQGRPFYSNPISPFQDIYSVFYQIVKVHLSWYWCSLKDRLVQAVSNSVTCSSATDYNLLLHILAVLPLLASCKGADEGQNVRKSLQDRTYACIRSQPDTYVELIIFRLPN